MVLLEGRAPSRPPQVSATTERGPPGNVALEGRALLRPRTVTASDAPVRRSLGEGGYPPDHP